MLYNKSIKTTKSGMFNITDDVRKFVKESNIQSGIVVVYNSHSTAGITVFSPMDELGYEDLFDEIDRIVPTRVNFKHEFDTPSDASGHIKSAIFGVEISLVVENGELLLGGSQGIFFHEFDGPRNRQFYVKVIGDNSD